jgi:anti-sigma factor RsiW
MTNNEELLQRCFDNDLNDAEMKRLFAALAGSASLREEFSSMQGMQHSLRSVAQYLPSVSLDRRVEQLTSGRRTTAAAPIRTLFRRTVPLRTVAIAVMLFVFVAGSLLLVLPVSKKEIETQYVYIVQMPPVVVTSIQ